MIVKVEVGESVWVWVTVKVEVGDTVKVGVMVKVEVGESVKVPRDGERRRSANP